jgi:hypothetical protein
MDIETLHGEIYVPTGGIDGPTFDVAPADDVVQVDITSLVFRGSPLEMNQLFLMIENRGIEQPAGSEGDRFRSRESASTPQLILGFLPSGPPPPTAAPTTKAPSKSPQPSPPPSTAAPSNSLKPTTSVVPSLSPSESVVPTAAPSAATNISETNTTLTNAGETNTTETNPTKINATGTN